MDQFMVFGNAHLKLLHFQESELKMRWSDCADAQTDLRICCLFTV